MQIEQFGVCLRDTVPDDIGDGIRWHTTETEWAQWDAPWYNLEIIRKFSVEDFWLSMVTLLAKEPPTRRKHMEISVGGVHIGDVSRYYVDSEYNWLPDESIGSGYECCAVGIDIYNSDFWGKGIGRRACASWILYLNSIGFYDICTQTWSGNDRMLKMACAVGFVELNRRRAAKAANGQSYDIVTLRLESERFRSFCEGLEGTQLIL